MFVLVASRDSKRPRESRRVILPRFIGVVMPERGRGGYVNAGPSFVGSGALAWKTGVGSTHRRACKGVGGGKTSRHGGLVAARRVS